MHHGHQGRWRSGGAPSHGGMEILYQVYGDQDRHDGGRGNWFEVRLRAGDNVYKVVIDMKYEGRVLGQCSKCSDMIR